jgi:hypothetical protein
MSLGFQGVSFHPGVSEVGAKVQLLLFLVVFFESFLKTLFRFLSYSPFNQRHHLLNLSKNLFFGRQR